MDGLGLNTLHSPLMITSAIVIRNLTHRFGHFAALQDIDLVVPKGQTFALFGPNGAGKTTLLRLIAALTRPSSGEIWVCGDNARRDPEMIRKNIGFISHHTMLYDDLTARENLAFYGRMYGLQNLDARVEEVLSAVGLTDRQCDRVRDFSRGMKQRLAIARSILHQPSILLLDEPFTGLDTAAQSMLSNLLIALKAEGRTVFLVTHDFAKGLALADRFGILLRGQLIREASTKEVDESELRTQINSRL